MKHCDCKFKIAIKRFIDNIKESLPVIMTRRTVGNLRGSAIVQQRHCKLYQAEIKELEEEIAQLKEQLRCQKS